MRGSCENTLEMQEITQDKKYIRTFKLQIACTMETPIRQKNALHTESTTTVAESKIIVISMQG